MQNIKNKLKLKKYIEMHVHIIIKIKLLTIVDKVNK